MCVQRTPQGDGRPYKKGYLISRERSRGSVPRGPTSSNRGDTHKRVIYLLPIGNIGPAFPITRRRLSNDASSSSSCGGTHFLFSIPLLFFPLSIRNFVTFSSAFGSTTQLLQYKKSSPHIPLLPSTSPIMHWMRERDRERERERKRASSGGVHCARLYQVPDTDIGQSV